MIQCPKCEKDTTIIVTRKEITRSDELDLVNGEPAWRIKSEILNSGYITSVECKECKHKGHPREFGLEPTLEEALRALDGEVINEALDAGWKPDLADIRERHRDHLTEFKKYELAEMYNDVALGEDPSLAREVNVLAMYFESAADEFFEDSPKGAEA